MLGLPPRPQAAALASTFVAVWMRNGIALDGALISFQNHFIYLFFFCIQKVLRAKSALHYLVLIFLELI